MAPNNKVEPIEILFEVFKLQTTNSKTNFFEL